MQINSRQGLKVMFLVGGFVIVSSDIFHYLWTSIVLPKEIQMAIKQQYLTFNFDILLIFHLNYEEIVDNAVDDRITGRDSILTQFRRLFHVSPQ